MQRYNLFPILLCTTIRLFTLLLLSIRHLHHKITIKLIKKSFLSQTWAKGGSINFHLKTSDFFGQKYGGFASKVRRFASKKSDVLHFPYTTTKKIFCENVLHFLHPFTKLPLCTGFFGCRMGCRMLLLGVGFGAKHCQKV